MTRQTITIEQSKPDVRALIGMTAATLAVLGGVLLWQVRPIAETATPVTSATSSTVSDGVAPRGGLAERYLEQQRESAAREAARVTTMGGIAEMYAGQEAEARATVERESRMGGMAEMYRDQEQARWQQAG